jgi:glycosyltransferase involved in cell wall biosynthesis
MLSLIIPVYKNQGNIPPLIAALEKLNTALAGAFETVCVVDGSPDGSYLALCEALPKAGFASQLLLLSRNFGSFSAIRAGMAAARGERIAVMAADLQEPPELVLEFDRILRDDAADVVFGKRVARKDPWLGRLSSTIFWGLYRRLVQKDVPEGGVDVFGCNARVREQLLRLPERNSSLLGLLFWIGFRRAFVPYERRQREIGRSAWTMAKKLRYLSDSVFGFSDLPIRLLLSIGSLSLVGSVVLAAIVVYERIVNLIPVRGYTPLMLAVMFFGALNCLGLGIIGSYVWRTFENTKHRPDHIVATHQRFGSRS